MATLIWLGVCMGIATVGAIIMKASLEYFVLGESKEEVISNIIDLL